VKPIDLDSLPKEVNESVESNPIVLIPSFASSVAEYDFTLLVGPMMQMIIMRNSHKEIRIYCVACCLKALQTVNEDV
jgi:hypothetical protein